jgi:hypothetical protein
VANQHLNFLACIVAALVAFVLGAAWYSPILFAKPWMAAHGYTAESAPELRKTAPRAYGVSLVCFVVMAIVLAILIRHMGITTVFGGAHLAALLWLGFAATIGLTANMYSRAPIALFVIDAGYQLVYMVVMGAILGAWQ